MNDTTNKVNMTRAREIILLHGSTIEQAIYEPEEGCENCPSFLRFLMLFIYKNEADLDKLKRAGSMWYNSLKVCQFFLK